VSILGVILIVVLLRAAQGKNLRAVFTDVFFWISLVACSVALSYLTFLSEPVQASSEDAEPVVANAILPLPPSEADAWQSIQDELSREFAGQNYAIYAEDLSNPARTISVNAEQNMKLASVYKLFIAYSILRQVDGGLDWDSALGGTTLEQCFDKMMIDSDNACAHAWGDAHGWRAVMSEASAIGSTVDLLQDNTFATANDVANLLIKIYRAEIVSPSARDKLFDVLKIQRFRSGIPAGANDKAVADKVGFMNSVLTDAGIVFGGAGDYVVVILTENYSWESIAATAETIDAGF
jgi:beta-lactamase class A